MASGALTTPEKINSSAPPVPSPSLFPVKSGPRPIGAVLDELHAAPGGLLGAARTLAEKLVDERGEAGDGQYREGAEQLRQSVAHGGRR